MVDNARYRKLNNIFLVKCTQQPDLQNKKIFHVTWEVSSTYTNFVFFYVLLLFIVFFIFSLSLCVLAVELLRFGRIEGFFRCVCCCCCCCCLFMSLMFLTEGE